MQFFSRISEKIREDVSLNSLIKAVLLLLIVLMVQMTWGIWSGLAARIWNVMKPFVFGFAIAYILRYPVRIGEKYGISRKIMVPAVYIVITALLAWMLSTLIPMLVDRTGSLINSTIAGLTWLAEKVGQFFADGLPAWLSGFTSNTIDLLSELRGLIPNVPTLVSQTLSLITLTVISVVISVFMLLSWDKIRHNTVTMTSRISVRFCTCVFAVNDEISDYVRSLLILMVIRAVEYSLLYFLIGNTDWLILGLLTAVSLLIPYVGPTAVNVIGILTSLSLPAPNVIALVVMILLLSNVDEYVVSPIVHSKNTHITPLWALFSLFAGNAVMGVPGIMIAIPVMLAIRTAVRMYSNQPVQAGVLKEEVEKI